MLLHTANFLTYRAPALTKKFYLGFCLWIKRREDSPFLVLQAGGLVLLLWNWGTKSYPKLSKSCTFNRKFQTESFLSFLQANFPRLVELIQLYHHWESILKRPVSRFQDPHKSCWCLLRGAETPIWER